MGPEQHLHLGAVETFLRQIGTVRRQPPSGDSGIRLPAFKSGDIWAAAQVVVAHRHLTSRRRRIALVPDEPAAGPGPETTVAGFPRAGARKRFDVSSGLRQALGLDGGVEYPVQLKAIDLADESRPQIIVPLTPLENLDQLETLKKTLGRSSPGELFPHELTRSDLVRSGVVVDILLNELARNVFDHARGCPAFVALATNDAFSQSCTPWEASFRAAVQATTRTSTRYLALVVADCGQGLVKSLSRSAFYSTEVNSSRSRSLPTRSSPMSQAKERRNGWLCFAHIFWIAA